MNPLVLYLLVLVLSTYIQNVDVNCKKIWHDLLMSHRNTMSVTFCTNKIYFQKQILG